MGGGFNLMLVTSKFIDLKTAKRQLIKLILREIYGYDLFQITSLSYNYKYNIQSNASKYLKLGIFW